MGEITAAAVALVLKRKPRSDLPPCLIPAPTRPISCSFMRPRLKISNLISLQDARSSAAVGFDLVSFNLTRGDERKLSAAMIWNLVQWISGPDIVLEMNGASLPELADIQQSFQPGYLTLPLAERSQAADLSGLPPLILKAEVMDDPEALAQLAAAQTDLRFELHLTQLADVARFAPVLGRSLLHFPSLDEAEAYLRSDAPVAWGLSLDREAEEEPGVLDYERIDQFIEVFEDHYGTPE
mgnify:CR=1 FL=1